MLTQDTPKLIGSVAQQSGVPIKTIRYYEELGLLKAIGRTEGRFRLFSSDVFTRLSFIKRAQSLGLTLSEIKDLLSVHDQGNVPCEEVKGKLQDKLNAIEAQIQQLLILKLELSVLLSESETIPESTTPEICPILERHQKVEPFKGFSVFR